MATRINQLGISVIEVVVGVAIAALVTLFIAHTLTLFFSASEQTLARTQALYLAEEGVEMLRLIRDSNWNNFVNDHTNDVSYSFALATSTIDTTATPEVIEGTFTRTFILSAVERNADDDIVSSGSVDSGSRYATVSVSWDGGSQSVSLSTLLTNIHDQ